MCLGELFLRMITSTPTAHEQTRILVQTAAQVCEEKKGEGTRILELDPIDSGLSDFFLITSATNDRQAIAIADEIEHRLKKEFGVYPTSVEGRRKGDWILLDYVDFVVHVFLAERRAFYDIERLRKSARPVTPAEFDEELKAALAARTRAARGKSGAPGDAASTRRRKSAGKAEPVKAAARPAKTAAKNGSVLKPKTPRKAASSTKAAKPASPKSAAKPAAKKKKAAKK